MQRHTLAQARISAIAAITILLAAVLGSAGLASSSQLTGGRAAVVGEYLDVTKSDFLLTWTATATQSYNVAQTYGFENGRLAVSLIGSARVRYTPYSRNPLPWAAYSFQEHFSYDELREANPGCPKPSWILRERVVDGGRWTGDANQTMDLTVIRDASGIYMRNPIAMREYTYLDDHTESTWVRYGSDKVTCGPYTEWSSKRSGYPSLLFDYPERVYPERLYGDATASTFRASLEKTIFVSRGYPEVPVPVRITWGITAQRLGACASGTAGDSIKLQATEDNIDPDSATSLTASVTCGGAPVSGAQLKVTSDVLAHSGWHPYDNEENTRPRGFVRKPSGAWTDATNGGSITLTTGADGNASFEFRPGRAKDDGKYDVAGIAGTYIVSVQSLQSPNLRDSQRITAKVRDLENIPANSNTLYVGFAGGPSYAFWGTPETRTAINSLADDFHKVQSVGLVLGILPDGQNRKLSVNDISLPDGGLMDIERNWRQPHLTHGRGYGFDVNRQLSWGTPGSPSYNMRRSMLLTLGQQYGHWDPQDLKTKYAYDVLYHLHVTQSSAASRALDAAPALSVHASANGPSGLPSSAPGQNVTAIISVDNLLGTADAHDVVVSATLPSGLSLVSASPTATTVSGGRVSWNIGTLAAAALPQMFYVTATVDTEAAHGTQIRVVADASTTDGQSNLAANRDDQMGLLVVQPPGADLVVTSDLPAADMTAGQPVAFTVNVANGGNAAAKAVVLSATLPVSATLGSSTPSASSSGLGHAWQLGDIAAGASRTVSIVVDVDPALIATLDPDAPVLSFELQAKSSTTEIDPSDDALRVAKKIVAPGPDATTWVQVRGAQPGYLPPGQDVTFAVHYANTGNQVAPSTTLTLSVGSGLSVIESTPEPARTLTAAGSPGGLLGWDLGDLAAGGSGVIEVRARVGAVPEYGTLVVATIGTSGIDIRPDNNVVAEARTLQPSVWRVALNPIVRAAPVPTVPIVPTNTPTSTATATSSTTATTTRTVTPTVTRTPTITATSTSTLTRTPSATATATASATSTATATATGSATTTATATTTTLHSPNVPNGEAPPPIRVR